MSIFTCFVYITQYVKRNHVTSSIIHTIQVYNLTIAAKSRSIMILYNKLETSVLFTAAWSFYQLAKYALKVHSRRVSQ